MENIDSDDDYLLVEETKKITTRILIPSNVALSKIKELIKENLCNNISKSKLFNIIIGKFSIYFNVSTDVAKKRIIELLYEYFDDVFNCSSDLCMRMRNYNRLHSILRIGSTTGNRYSRVLRDCINISDEECEERLYADDVLVSNGSSAVYVPMHSLRKPTKSVLRQNLGVRALYGRNNIKSAHGIISDFESGAEVSHIINSGRNINKFSNNNIMKSIEIESGFNDVLVSFFRCTSSNFDHYYSHLDKLPRTIDETIMYHLDRNKGWTFEKLAETCDISDPTLRKYAHGKATPDRLKVLKIALALRLSSPYVKDMLNKIDCHKTQVTEENIIFDKLVVLADCRYGLPHAYEMLLANNQEDFLKMSDKWKEFHGYL